MNKVKKSEINFCYTFVDRIKDYCATQEDFYNKIAQNSDHSEDFINRMTELASSFHAVGQFIDICAERAFDSMLNAPFGDSNFTLGQTEQSAEQNTSTNTTTADEE